MKSLLGVDNWVLVVAALVMTVGWTVAYVGIVKRAFQDGTLGMPLCAMYANFSWEIIFSFIYPDERLLIEAGNITWCFVDVVIVITAFRFGRQDFAHPFVKRWYYPMVVFGLVLGFGLVWGFATQFNDRHGTYIAFFDNLMMSTLFIAMMLRRGSVAGQSVYIALGKLIGTVAAWAYVVVDHEPSLVVNIIAPAILVLDTIYTTLVFQGCRAAGLNPWRRF
jgi:hypothetical protein